MREILFRGKRKDNGEWVEGWLLGNPNRSGGIFIVTYYQFALDKKTGTKYEIPPKSLEYYEVLPETVGQFTDVIDKNEVKIFEGDKVKAELCGIIIDNIEAIVEYENGCFGIRALEDFPLCNGKGQFKSFDGCNTKDKIEVIGNIHEEAK